MAEALMVTQAFGDFRPGDLVEADRADELHEHAGKFVRVAHDDLAMPAAEHTPIPAEEH